MKPIMSVDEMWAEIKADPTSYYHQQIQDISDILEERGQGKVMLAEAEKFIKPIKAYYLVWQDDGAIGHVVQMPGYFVKRYEPGGQYVFRVDFAVCAVVDDQVALLRDLEVLLVPIDDPSVKTPEMHFCEITHAEKIIGYITRFTEHKHKILPFEMMKEWNEYKRNQGKDKV
ncbi:MAG: hypothetical protein P4L77_10620 [Sulfuriferula sp.]|nr:hypothetical protein [Sulfuriferula sp.]